MSNTVEIKVRAKAEGGEEVQGLGKTIGEMKSELSELSKTADNAEAYRKLSAQYLELAKTMDTAAAGAGGMGIKIRTALSDFNVRPVSEVRSEIGKLTESYTLLKTSGSLSFTEMQKVTRNYQKQVADLRGEYNGVETSLSSIRTGMLAVAGATYTAGKAVGTYLGFSKEMANVSTLVDVSKEKFAGFTQEIENLSGKFPQSAKEFASASYDVLSAGVSIDRTSNVLAQSAKAAAAGVTDVKTAAGAGVGVINAYGMSIDNLGHIYDIMFKAVKDGVTTFPELSQNIGDVLPTAKAAGVQFDSVAAAIAAMTKAGMRTPIAATALKGAINAMAAPAPEAKKQFDALGITWQGLVPTLEQIQKLGLGLDQMKILIPDVEARTAVLSLTQNMDVLKQTMAGMTEAAGATEAAYEKIKDAPDYQVELFRKEIESLTLSVGQSMVPILLSGISGLEAFGRWFKDSGDATHYLAGGLGLAISAGAAWKLAIGPMTEGVKAFVGQMTLAAETAPALAASLATLAKGAVIAWGVAETWEAIRAFMDMREAAGQLEAAQERLSKQTADMKNRFREFAEVQVPGDLFNKPLADLEELASALAKSRAYYTASLTEMEEKSKETDLFGNLTDEAKQAKIQMAELKLKQEEITSAIGLTKSAIAEKRAASEAATGAEVSAVDQYKKAIEAGTMAVTDQMAAIAKSGGITTGYYADVAKAEAEMQGKRLSDLETLSKAKADELKRQVAAIELAEAQGVKAAVDSKKEKVALESAHLEDSLFLLNQRLKAAEAVANAETVLSGKASKEILSKKEAIEKEITAAQDAQSKARIQGAADETDAKKKIFEQELKSRYTDEITRLKESLSARQLEIDESVAKEVKTKAEGEKEKLALETEFTEKSISLAKSRLSAIQKEVAAEVAIKGQADGETLSARDAAEKALNELVQAAAKNRIHIAENEAADRKSALEKEASASKKAASSVDEETASVKENTQAKKANAEATGEAAEAKVESIRISVSVKNALDEEAHTLDQLVNLARNYYGWTKQLFHTDSDVKNFKLYDSLVGQYEQLIAEASRYGLALDASNMTLEDAKAKVKELRDAFTALTDQIAQVRSDTDETLREMKRATMSDEEAWADVKAQYQETMVQAAQMASRKNYEAASELYLQAKTLAESLAREVKNVSGETVKTLKDTTAQASALMQEASDKAVASLQRQQEALSKTQASSGVSSMKYATGGKLPGFGYEDSVPAMLTPGERVTNAYSVRIWDSVYPGLMDAMNAARSSGDTRRILSAFSAQALKFNAGGIVPGISINVPVAGAGSAGKTIEIRFTTDSGKTGSVMADGPSSELLLRQLKKARMVSG